MTRSSYFSTLRHFSRTRLEGRLRRNFHASGFAIRVRSPRKKTAGKG